MCEWRGLETTVILLKMHYNDMCRTSATRDYLNECLQVYVCQSNGIVDKSKTFLLDMSQM